jgi:hypothetical protein
MTFDEWFDLHFVGGNLRSREPMFLHERDRLVAREAWDAALKSAQADACGSQKPGRTMRPFEPGLD